MTSRSAATQKSLLEMTDAELQNLPAEQKRQLLASFGISAKHLRKTKGGKLDRAFLDVVRALKSPGQHKLTLKLAKKYELKLRVGQDGQLLEAQAKQKKGFFGKLIGVLKMVAPIAGILLAPVTGGLSLVVSSAISAVDAIKHKNWLGTRTMPEPPPRGSASRQKRVRTIGMHEPSGSQSVQQD